MSVETPISSPIPASEPSGDAHRLMRTALKGALGTLDRTTGHPYTSLVLVAAEPDGSPILLISRLALHTQNLASDARASLLLDGTDGLGDPMAGGRITLSGHMRLTESPTAKPRFLARHPTAHRYADLPDFATYTFEVRSGHYIGGFGRIVDLPSEALLSSADPAPELAAAEADIINHMNTDHADAIALYATEIAKCAPGTWRMCGIDSSGFDLLDGSSAARIDFPEHVRTPNEARVALVALVKQARARNATNSHGLP